MALIPIKGSEIWAAIPDDCYEQLKNFKYSLVGTKKGKGAIFRGYWQDGKLIKVNLANDVLGLRGFLIDHKDHDPFNNHRENLRLCSWSENNCNAVKRKGTSSKYKGVAFDKQSKKWRAYISKDFKRINLGQFDTEDEAALAYNNVAILLHKEFAVLNVICCDISLL